ncbi:MAG: hypothetical protein CL613_02365, partial [Aquimarina sp.]|nr:hypothetical protein [Aquimarina sp.]
MKKHYYNSITKLIILLLVIVTIRMNGQAPGTMDFGTSIVILANGTNPSADQSQSTLLNNFDVSATSNGDIILALANSGNGAGTDAIGGASDAVLGWFGNGGAAVSSGTLSTDNGTEIRVTNLVFAYEQAIGSSVVDFTITGKRDGATVGTLDLISPLHNTAITIDFTIPTTGSFLNIDELVITPNSPIFGGFSIDDKVVGSAISCTNPDVPTVTYTPSTVCEGNNATLNISGNLNDATQWVIYTDSCGGTQIGTTSTSSFVVTPSSPSTIYYVRGEDGAGCVDESSGSCGSITVNVTADDDASFSYGATTYCVNNADPTPTITGLAGGTFSSTAGLSINASTGQIDVSASTPNTYTVTYTTAGSCPNSSNVSVTINALDNVSFSYSAAAYCIDASDPTPTITGLAGGTFSSTAGLSLNSSTGQIDVSASTPNTYTVTYTTAGTCPNSSNVSVTINALDDAS